MADLLNNKLARLFLTPAASPNSETGEDKGNDILGSLLMGVGITILFLWPFFVIRDIANLNYFWWYIVAFVVGVALLWIGGRIKRQNKK